jgi:hypothetical protein
MIGYMTLNGMLLDISVSSMEKKHESKIQQTSNFIQIGAKLN